MDAATEARSDPASPVPGDAAAPSDHVEGAAGDDGPPDQTLHSDPGPDAGSDAGSDPEVVEPSAPADPVEPDTAPEDPGAMDEGGTPRTGTSEVGAGADEGDGSDARAVEAGAGDADSPPSNHTLDEAAAVLGPPAPVQPLVPPQPSAADEGPDGAPGGEGSDDLVPTSRAELQADLRKERKRERKHRRRWLRRSVYVLSALVVLVGAAAGGLYFYAGYRFDQIKKVHFKHLVKEAAPGKPFTVLMVGSDSRAFVNNPTEVKAFGTTSNAGGQRSDVTMVARVVPATKSITIMSIPRDLWVDIPKNSSDIEGMNRINAAYDSGPDLLVQTIETDLGIPINHYVSVGFEGFLGMVNALGGVSMDFPTEVKDAYTGLDVTTTGCQVINGQTALQLVRSRHLQYLNSDGYWEYDGLSDFSRIQRQDAFFRSILSKVDQSLLNPLAINGFLGAAVSNLAIDDTMTKSELFSLAYDFKGFSASHLTTETLPTVGYTTDGGADVLLQAEPYAQNMINSFNRIGLAAPKPATHTTQSTTTTTAPSVSPDQVDVEVFNAGATNGAAGDTADALRSAGFTVSEVGNAPNQLPAGSTSQIWYGSGGSAAAHALGAALDTTVTYQSDPSLTGNTVALMVVGAAIGVNAQSTGSTTTTTTVPSTESTEGTTTAPLSEVYTNTQAEPWNPTPCQATSQATPTTTSTTHHGASGKGKATSVTTRPATPARTGSG